VALIVHMEPMVDSMALQIGDKSGNVDNSHVMDTTVQGCPISITTLQTAIFWDFCTT
jgi:hypothetical protein